MTGKDVISNNNSLINTKKMLLLYIVISIISTMICFHFCSETDKSYLTLLPLCTAFLFSIFYLSKNNIGNNISVILIDSLFLIRLTILPMLYSFNINRQLFVSNINVCGNFQNACLLMIYEFVAIQITILFHVSLKKKTPKVYLEKKLFNSKISDVLILLLCAFIIICFIFFNSYITPFKNIFGLGEYEFTIQTNKILLESGSFGKIINTLFGMSFQIFRILAPAYCLNKMYHKKSKHSSIALIFFCFLQFLFLTSTFAEAIVSCLCIVLYFIKLYPEKKKKMLLILFFSTIGIFLLYFIVRFFVRVNMNMSNNNAVFYYSQITNAYFTGVDNVSAMFNVNKSHKVEVLKADLLGAVPFNSTLFGDRGNKLQFYYNAYNKSYGQIQPTIGVGYYIFGGLLAPIISVLFTKFSLVLNDKSQKIGLSFRYVAIVFCCVLFAFGIVMYNPSITFSWLLGWGIPMILISHFDNS